MYCPEDGTEIPYNGDKEKRVGARYDPCPECGVTWFYESFTGGYTPTWQPTQPPKPFGD